KTRQLNTNEYIEISFVSELQFPCSSAEYAIIRKIHESLVYENDSIVTENHAYIQLKQASFYRNYLEDLILPDDYLFTQYYRDQLLRFLDEYKIQLSIDFVHHLLCGSKKQPVDQIKYYLANPSELKDLLRIFEYGSLLLKTDIEKIIVNIENPINFPLTTNDLFYKLILKDDAIYQIPPKTSVNKLDDVNEKFIFNCDGDPMIENCLMNLIEIIITPKYLQNIDSIQKILFIYGRINQEMLKLKRYTVSNLEKLQPLINLLNSIVALYKDPLYIFQNVFKNYIATNSLNTCLGIHDFVIYLRRLSNNFKTNLDATFTNKILIKLEIELLKNWLQDNSDKYDYVLQVLNQPNNDLWKYSAKILTYIERNLELFENVETNHGQVAIINEFEQFERSLKKINSIHRTMKIERLISNRIHLYLKQLVQKEQIENTLNDNYEYFEQNLIQLQDIINEQQIEQHVKLISLISWLKYYAEMYAYLLIVSESQHEIMRQIDRLLSNNDSAISSSIKIFIIKQSMYFANISFDGMKKIVSNRNIVWLKPIVIQQDNQQQEQNNLIIPTPLFELKNVSIDISFIQMIENQLQHQLLQSFEPIGYHFILLLCRNFDNQSYFQLKADMTDNDVYLRLTALNIFALFLSSKCTTNLTFMNSLLFDTNRKMPNNYSQHLMTRCLLGLIPNNNHIVTQMNRVKHEVQQRLNKRQIDEKGKFIYQCSKNCYYMYYFEDCGMPNDRSRCPLCKNEIGSNRRGSHQLLQRDPPQIQLPIANAFQLIDQYIVQYNQTNRYGYYVNAVQADNSILSESSDHLPPVAYRLFHMFTHTIMLMLYEMKYLQQPKSSGLTINYFREHFQKDYQLIGNIIAEHDEHQIWLCKILNHLASNDVHVNGVLDTNVKVIEFEKRLEQTIVLPHIQSVPNEIKQYRLAYSEFIRENHAEPPFYDYINELVENEQRYPLLNFLTVTRSTNNIVNEFHTKFYLLRYEELYPITDYVLKHLLEIEQIQFIYPIVNFTNYLLQKYNHRIL
ncbi:unnamed protein product, partial [Didymodactylos carnosus]